jgi:hypothetical protein
MTDSDYIKRIEEQNAELQEKLTKAESLLVPSWISIVRDCCWHYVICGHQVFGIVEVCHRRTNHASASIISISDTYNISSKKIYYFKTIDEAKQFVEERFKILFICQTW